MSDRLPASFLPRPGLTGIKITSFCSAPGCTSASPCPDCQWILTGECFLCPGGKDECLPNCPNLIDERD